MKKTYLHLAISSLLATCFIGIHSGHAANWYDACELKNFRLTAYYSPLSGQRFYVQGSFEADQILNGEGLHGASGKPVFNGMLAAPKSYAFGTRIYIPKRGIGQIEDRGGAIVQAGERQESYDRLDVWAGRGEEGLTAALRFGVRYYEAYVCPPKVGGDQIGFDFDAIPNNTLVASSLRESRLAPGQVSVWVPVLQKYLMKLGFMKPGETSTFYTDATKKAVCAYQQRAMGLPQESQRCGRFGEKTSASLRAYLQNLEKPLTQKIAVEKSKPVSNELKPQIVTPEPQVAFTRQFDYNERSPEIVLLQKKLQKAGYYPTSEPCSGVYDAFTLRAVYALQVDKLITDELSSPFDIGYLTTETRAVLNTL